MSNLRIKIKRLIIFLIIRKRGSLVNSYGSITVPSDLQSQYSLSLHKIINEFKTLIRPIVLNKNDMKRYGSESDGGYIVAKASIKESTFFISGGIANNNDFEIELANLGFKGIQIDNSINEPPASHPNLSFIKATLGNIKEIDIDSLCEKFPINESGILKLDIEGSEYNVLKEMNKFLRFSAVIIEFHNLHKLSDQKFWNDFKKILLKLNKNFSVIYLSANNCCGYSIIGGVAVPNVMEVTWVRKDLINGRKFLEIDTVHSSNMKSNYPERAPLDVSAFSPNLTL